MSDTDWTEFLGPSNAPEFKFENVGDAITGEVNRVEIVDTKYGRRPVLEIATGDGPRVLWAGQTQLQRLLAESNVQRGHKVRITWTGEEAGEGGKNPMKTFTVEVKRPEKAKPAPTPPPVEDNGPLEEPF